MSSCDLANLFIDKYFSLTLDNFICTISKMWYINYVTIKKWFRELLSCSIYKLLCLFADLTYCDVLDFNLLLLKEF